MKNKFTFIIAASLIFYSASFAQTTYYIPGTGTAVKELTFEAPALLSESFDYSSGWAGAGFGLSGTQRGAPEIVSVIANPEIVASSGSQVLAFRSQTRDAAWYTANPSAVGTTYYGGADTETQDDFFMYGASWVSAETPSVMMYMFLPSSLDASGVSSLRMPVKYNSGTSSWPGIWCYGDELYLRGPGRNDIVYTTNAPNGGKDTWWTLGLSIDPDGDIQYYATPSFVTILTAAHCIGFNSVLSPANGHAYHPVDENSDAIIMSSNRNLTATPTLIDRLYYTKGTTTQVLSISKNDLESIAIYPNPTSDYLFVNEIINTTSYKMFDSLGRAIKAGSVTSSSNRIEVNSLPKGIYFLALDGYKVNRFIKK
jgi:hypothetical protein